jgi:TPP-dependent pyruvate/acetoin dehydrogenase alpha subunit
MPADLWSLYPLMLKSRLFEEAIAKLWHDGFISGEMHLGTGEEAVVAAVVSQLRDGDAMALDHRGTAAFIMRGVDPASILKELLGRSDGLCGGAGGHMHLYSREILAASSGIVGSPGPCAAGLALAAQYLNPGSIAVAFFGEGAMNQGMLMESLNLAAVWNLPVLFVCKDDGWSITAQSRNTTGGDLEERARGLGVHSVAVDGLDVSKVLEVSGPAVKRARSGQGPSFLRATCVHLEGHFLGYQLLRAVREPVKEIPGIAVRLTRSMLKPGGAAIRERAAGVKSVFRAVLSTLRDPRRNSANDPLLKARNPLLSDSARLNKLENHIEQEIVSLVESVLAEMRS